MGEVEVRVGDEVAALAKHQAEEVGTHVLRVVLHQGHERLERRELERPRLLAEELGQLRHRHAQDRA